MKVSLERGRQSEACLVGVLCDVQVVEASQPLWLNVPERPGACCEFVVQQP